MEWGITFHQKAEFRVIERKGQIYQLGTIINILIWDWRLLLRKKVDNSSGYLLERDIAISLDIMCLSWEGLWRSWLFFTELGMRETLWFPEPSFQFIPGVWGGTTFHSTFIPVLRLSMVLARVQKSPTLDYGIEEMCRIVLTGQMEHKVVRTRWTKIIKERGWSCKP